MKTKSKLVLGLSILSAATMASATTATFAWYSATGATKVDNAAATTNLKVENKNQALGKAEIIVSPQTTGDFGVDGNDSLVITNRAGRSYYKAGASYYEIMDDDTDQTTNIGDTHKQGRIKFNVSIVGKSSEDAYQDLTSDVLAGLTDGTHNVVYYIKVTAGGSVKVSLTQTSTLGSHDKAAEAAADWTATGVAADGVLGKALGQAVDVMRITITPAGVVSYALPASATADEVITWGSDNTWVIATDGVQVSAQSYDGCAIQASAAVFVGLEVDASHLADATSSILDNSKLTPTIGTTEAHTAG